MPVFTAATAMSVATASICATTMRGSSATQSRTATEFCAVTAVMAEAPCSPWAAKVSRSAWIPAPPPESDPATVRAMRGTRRPQASAAEGGAPSGAREAGAPNLSWKLMNIR